MFLAVLWCVIALPVRTAGKQHSASVSDSAKFQSSAVENASTHSNTLVTTVDKLLQELPNSEAWDRDGDGCISATELSQGRFLYQVRLEQLAQAQGGALQNSTSASRPGTAGPADEMTGDSMGERLPATAHQRHLFGHGGSHADLNVTGGTDELLTDVSEDPQVDADTAGVNAEMASDCLLREQAITSACNGALMKDCCEAVSEFNEGWCWCSREAVLQGGYRLQSVKWMERDCPWDSTYTDYEMSDVCRGNSTNVDFSEDSAGTANGTQNLTGNWAGDLGTTYYTMATEELEGSDAWKLQFTGCQGVYMVYHLVVNLEEWEVYDEMHSQLGLKMFRANLPSRLGNVFMYGTVGPRDTIYGYATSLTTPDHVVAFNATYQGMLGLTQTCNGNGFCALADGNYYACKCDDYNFGVDCKYSTQNTEEYYVQPVGTTSGHGTQGVNFTSLRAALTLTSEEAARTIWLRPGVYQGDGNTRLSLSNSSAEGSIPLPLQTLTLRSTDGPLVTVVDCGSEAWFLVLGGSFEQSFDRNLEQSSGVQLEGFTVQNCVNGKLAGSDTSLGSMGSAIEVYNWLSRFQLKNMVLTGGRGGHGAVHVVQCAHVMILECSLTNNSAEDLGQMDVATGNGGALTAEYSVLDILDTTFEHNRAKGFGGAVAAEGDASLQYSTLSMKNVLFRNNTAGSEGGGLHIVKVIYANLEDMVFLDNSVVAASSGRTDSAFAYQQQDQHRTSVTGGSGGAMMVINCDVDIKRARFASNQARHFGGVSPWPRLRASLPASMR
ncbi:hypothetical protein CYMTET_52905, partial [Cymbomonas tetramitiformis]